MSRTSRPAPSSKAADTAETWSSAFLDGRIRKKRVNGGTRLTIEETWQKEARIAKRERASLMRA